MQTQKGHAMADSARAGVLDFGVRRTPLFDVARRAGLSRMIERSIAEDQADGSIRPGPVRALAAIVLQIEQSVVFSAPTIPGATRTELLEELENALHGVLAPPNSFRLTLPSWQ
jgi:hypothetical protein